MEPHETFSQRVRNFDIEFTEKLLELMKKIKDIATQNPSDKFINLIHRYNLMNKYKFMYKLIFSIYVFSGSILMHTIPNKLNLNEMKKLSVKCGIMYLINNKANKIQLV